MRWLYAQSYLQLELNYEGMWIFLAAVIFKSLLLKMAATVMAVEFGNIHHYSSLEENSEACLCSPLNKSTKINRILCKLWHIG